MPLRNPIFYLGYALPMYLLKILRLDTPFMLVYFPRIIEVFWAAMFDSHLILTCRYYMKKEHLVIAFVGTYVTWCTLWYYSRLVVNTAEGALFIWAFFYWKRS